jgi:hypothetical protein
MRVVKDFAGTPDGSQLALKVGDILYVQPSNIQNGLVKAKMGGKEGLVPVSHIQEATD